MNVLAWGSVSSIVLNMYGEKMGKERKSKSEVIGFSKIEYFEDDIPFFQLSEPIDKPYDNGIVTFTEKEGLKIVDFINKILGGEDE